MAWNEIVDESLRMAPARVPVRIAAVSLMALLALAGCRGSAASSAPRTLPTLATATTIEDQTIALFVALSDAADEASTRNHGSCASIAEALDKVLSANAALRKQTRAFQSRMTAEDGEVFESRYAPLLRDKRDRYLKAVQACSGDPLLERVARDYGL